MKHKNPTRFQREMVVQGWRLVPQTALVFAAADGTWTVQDAHGHAPETSNTAVLAHRIVSTNGGLPVPAETRSGRAGAICKKINPSFRVHAIAV